ncbi:MAG TPA: N-acetylmuramoyl-L-alanine amidase [Elusimicrobiota bacterium]|nr:N-acetylmuramoyl-L-alanine amidase [Elusimicrobiota bacterium]
MRVPLTAGLAALWLAAAPCFVFGQARRPPLDQEKFTAVVDGKIRTDLSTLHINAAPCLALGDVQRLFGGRQSWRRVSRRVSYEVSGRRMEFQLDASTAVVDGRTVTLDFPALYWSGQVYLPVSFLVTKEFQRAVEAKTAWDPAARTLLVEPVPSVSSPRFYSYPEKSRVVVELGPRVHFRVLGYRNNRLYVRFFGGRSLGNEKIAAEDGLVEWVQLIGHARSSDLTLALSPEAGTPRVTQQETPRQMVIEVAAKKDPPVFSPSVSLPAPTPDPSAPDADDALFLDEDLGGPTEPVSPLLALSPIKTIVVDAGHGGQDVGAVGPHGTLEKDVNLEMAKALARVLKRERRFNVVLTRNDDTFIPLDERFEVANKHKADLFISIHSNAALSSRSNGFEVYFLSEKATDDAAAAVARRENAVVEMEGVAGKTKQKLQELLWSLARTETMNESSEIAALMLRQVGKRVRIPMRGAKQAGFVVLKGANMPAVLVESAFISHPKEEGLLRSRRFRTKMADGLYAGILDYEKRKIQARAQKTAGKSQ